MKSSTDVEEYHYEKDEGVRIKVGNPSSDEVRQTREYSGSGKWRERRHSKPQGRKTWVENQSNPNESPLNVRVKVAT